MEEVFKSDSYTEKTLHMPRYNNNLNLFSSREEREYFIRGDKYSTPNTTNDGSGSFDFGYEENNSFKNIGNDSIRNYLKNFRFFSFGKNWVKAILRSMLLLISLIFIFILLFKVLKVKETVANNKKIRKARKIFYLLDVEKFQDSDDNGIGDFDGITQNLHHLKSFGVSHIILTNYPSNGLLHNSSKLEFENLLKSAKNLTINILWDITSDIILNQTDIIPTNVDGFYFSSSRYSRIVKSNITKEKFINIHNIVFNLNSTCIVEISIEKYVDFEKIDTTIYRHSTIIGVIFSIKILNKFQDYQISEKIYAYNYYLQQINRFKHRFKFYDIIFNFRSNDLNKNGTHMYTYFYALISFSRFPIMLNFGQELITGKHDTCNYKSEMSEILEGRKKSYIHYLRALNNATDHTYIRKSLKSPIRGSMNNSYTWMKRRVDNQNIEVFAFSSFHPLSYSFFESFKNRTVLIFEHNLPSERTGDGNLTEFSVYFGYKEAENNISESNI